MKSTQWGRFRIFLAGKYMDHLELHLLHILYLYSQINVLKMSYIIKQQFNGLLTYIITFHYHFGITEKPCSMEINGTISKAIFMF